MLFRTCSGGMGLTNLRWNGFSVSVGSNQYAPLTTPSFVVSSITTVLGAQGMACSQITLGISSGVIPAWAQPGAGVAVNVTIAGVPILVGGIIKDVTASTMVISPSSTDAKNITKVYTNASLDAVGGSVVNTVTLNMMCQTAIFYLPASATQNVSIAMVADSNGANPGYTFTITPGGPAFELTAPVGAKFDIADLFFLSSLSAQNLMVAFL